MDHIVIATHDRKVVWGDPNGCPINTRVQAAAIGHRAGLGLLEVLGNMKMWYKFNNRIYF